MSPNARYPSDLTDAQWALVDSLLSDEIPALSSGSPETRDGERGALRRSHRLCVASAPQGLPAVKDRLLVVRSLA